MVEVVVFLKDASSGLEAFKPYLMRYSISAAGDVGAFQVMFCWMLPSSLTDTDPLVRLVTTPGASAAEHDFNDKAVHNV